MVAPGFRLSLDLREFRLIITISTAEFSISQGLKTIDPVISFLVHKIMESLHYICFKDGDARSGFEIEAITLRRIHREYCETSLGKQVTVPVPDVLDGKT
ncbi:hypothetical protein Tco_0417782 [Tanacetum coccineum]